jgi:hypothetical protein
MTRIMQPHREATVRAQLQLLLFRDLFHMLHMLLRGVGLARQSGVLVRVQVTAAAAEGCQG